MVDVSSRMCGAHLDQAKKQPPGHYFWVTKDFNEIYQIIEQLLLVHSINRDVIQLHLKIYMWSKISSCSMTLGRDKNMWPDLQKGVFHTHTNHQIQRFITLVI